MSDIHFGLSEEDARTPSVLGDPYVSKDMEEVIQQMEEFARRLVEPGAEYLATCALRQAYLRTEQQLKLRCKELGWVHANTYNEEEGKDEVWVSPEVADRLTAAGRLRDWYAYYDLKEGTEIITFP